MGFAVDDVVELFGENYAIASAKLDAFIDETNTAEGAAEAEKLDRQVSKLAAAQTKRACIALYGRQAGEKAWSDAWSVIQRNDLSKDVKQGRRKDKGGASRRTISASRQRISTKPVSTRS
ncbi:MAG: hypothetical protein O3B90_13355 [Actinomycetota bacterium]|nr:hypothetical protein [Actinomycetota bacterium]